VVHAALSSLGGVHLATWLNCSPAGAMIVMACVLFGLAWILGPHDGLIRRWYLVRSQTAPGILPAQTIER